MSKYVFIFEGCDGSGKSSSIEAACERHSNTCDILTVREPGGTDLGEEVRRLLRLDEGSHLSVAAEMTLFWAGRHQLWMEKVIPFLMEDGQKPRAVFFDRSFPSTFAYNIRGRQAGPELEEIHNANIKALMAAIRKKIFDRHIEIHHMYFDIRPELAEARLEKREKAEGSNDDLLQFNDLVFQRRVYEGYDQFYKLLVEKTLIRQSSPPEFVHRVNAAGTHQEVATEVSTIFQGIFRPVIEAIA